MTSEAQKRASAKYKAKSRKEGKRSVITFDATAAYMAELDAYAAYKGLPRATMIRECIKRSQEADGWTHQPAVVQDDGRDTD